MSRRLGLIVKLILLWLPLPLLTAASVYEPSPITPPSPPREFRAAWVATVANIDWPSKPGLSVLEQKYELVTLLDAAVRLNLNTIIFQVRPAADSIYASPIEPWSEYLTGTQGRAPTPFYDPLAFALQEAHERGLAVHAWFNPFRAGHPNDRSAPALNHISRTHPELIRHYSDQTWLDPGEPFAQSLARDVVLDVVKRYDIDGVIFDDYFYPYPVKGWSGHYLDFPDEASWKKYGSKTGLTREDWRRNNINQFVHQISQAIKTAKPWVAFGISPFGIWRPQNPPQIKGLDAYGQIYADSHLWLANGWVDYLAPQLYWAVAQHDQSFPVLLNWWHHQNPLERHLWAGLNDSSFDKFGPGEISRQIQCTREYDVPGQIHYHLRSILQTPALLKEIASEYSQPALIPTSPWINNIPPEKPALLIIPAASSLKLHWAGIGAKPACWWVLQYANTNRLWTTDILPAKQQNFSLNANTTEVISIRAVDRLGNLSPSAVFACHHYSSPLPPRHNSKSPP
jgi:uncharacterized lipoprotein YddW (UPF0748 family)